MSKVTCAKQELAQMFHISGSTRIMAKKLVAQEEEDQEEAASFQKLQLMMARCCNTAEMVKLMQSDNNLVKKITETRAMEQQTEEEPSEEETEGDIGKETNCCHYHDLLSVM